MRQSVFFIFLLIFLSACNQKDKKKQAFDILNQHIEQSNEHIENYLITNYDNKLERIIAQYPNKLQREVKISRNLWELNESFNNYVQESLDDTLPAFNAQDLTYEYVHTLDSMESFIPAKSLNNYSSHRYPYQLNAGRADIMVNQMKNDILKCRLDILKLLIDSIKPQLWGKTYMAFIDVHTTGKKLSNKSFKIDLNARDLIPPYVPKIKIDSIKYKGSKIRPDYEINDKQLLGNIVFNDLEAGYYELYGYVSITGKNKKETRMLFQHFFTIKSSK